ncbi:MAG: hypothetical protein DHS20C15_09540 [Planctomycetota bacterium]|nr:MAG: hypothetical protein DHS20C15_09540 [Planctomycetota bacterium]
MSISGFGTRFSAAALALGGFALAPSVAASDVHFVPADFADLQTAIDVAAAGDTVVILGGGDYEYISIDKPITLVGSASQPPLLRISPLGAPVCDDGTPAVTISNPGGTVNLVGVDIGGGQLGSLAEPCFWLPGAMSFSGDSDLAVLHSSVIAPEWLEYDGWAPAYSNAVSVGGAGTFLVSDSVIRGHDHKMLGAWCDQKLDKGPSGTILGTERQAVLLDSHLEGGGSLQEAWYSNTCQGWGFLPTACSEFLEGAGGPGLIGGSALLANSEILAGPAATVVFLEGYPEPAGFPCVFENSPAYLNGTATSIDTGATLSGSGAIVEFSDWSVRWDVSAESKLLIGPALITPQQAGAAGQLFVDPAGLVMLPIDGVGPGQRSFQINGLRDDLLGKLIAVQIYSPEQGFSRPVIAALQPF